MNPDDGFVDGRLLAAEVMDKSIGGVIPSVMKAGAAGSMFIGPATPERPKAKNQLVEYLENNGIVAHRLPISKTFYDDHYVQYVTTPGGLKITDVDGEPMTENVPWPSEAVRDEVLRLAREDGFSKLIVEHASIDRVVLLRRMYDMDSTEQREADWRDAKDTLTKAEQAEYQRLYESVSRNRPTPERDEDDAIL